MAISEVDKKITEASKFLFQGADGRVLDRAKEFLEGLAEKYYVTSAVPKGVSLEKAEGARCVVLDILAHCPVSVLELFGSTVERRMKDDDRSAGRAGESEFWPGLGK